MHDRAPFGPAEDPPTTDDQQTGGRKPPIYSEDFTPSAPSSGNLADRTIASLQRTFRVFGHEPSVAMWDGLKAVAETLDGMASGACDPAVYVSSLDPGVGKTQLVVHFLRELLQSEEHRDVGAIICLSRKDQIRSIVDDASLDKFAVLTADQGVNAIATAEVNDARVLFTTQQMVEARCQHAGSFASALAFHFNGRVRAVRIWDEAMLPGQPLTVSLDELRALPLDFRAPHRGFTNALDDLIKQIELSADGAQLATADLPSQFDVPIRVALKAIGNNSANAKTVQKLWHLFGRTVTVRKGWGVVILDYRDTLPQDLKPVLVLDASARVRATYQLWSRHRGDLIRLSSAQKDYSGLTINVWSRSGGKDAFANDGGVIADGVASTIRTKPREEWLIIHHKPTVDFDFEKMVRARLSSDPIPVHFLTWGQHDATNKFASVSNVILAGTLFKPKPVYEALGRLAAALPSSSGLFEQTASVALGEHCHGVLQALCRGAVRGYRDGACPNTDAFIIASQGSGIPRSLSEMFPGAVVADWQPVPKQLRGQPERAFDYITGRIEDDPTSIVRFGDVADHLRIERKSLRLIRRRADLTSALDGQGIKEWEDEYGTPRGFWHQYRYLFSDAADD